MMGDQMTIDVGVVLSYDDNSDEVDYYGNSVKDKIDWLPYVDFVRNF
jgi:hypothetical protein